MEMFQPVFQFKFYNETGMPVTKGTLTTSNNEYYEAVAWVHRQFDKVPTMVKCELTELVFGMPTRKSTICKG